jgi:hypothetical protein
VYTSIFFLLRSSCTRCPFIPKMLCMSLRIRRCMDGNICVALSQMAGVQRQRSERRGAGSCSTGLIAGTVASSVLLFVSGHWSLISTIIRHWFPAKKKWAFHWPTSVTLHHLSTVAWQTGHWSCWGKSWSLCDATPPIHALATQVTSRWQGTGQCLPFSSRPILEEPEKKNGSVPDGHGT